MHHLSQNSFNTQSTLNINGDSLTCYLLPALQQAGYAAIDRLPFTVKIFLENLLRHEDGQIVTREQIDGLANWQPGAATGMEFPFFPARVLLQDFTGVPAVADLAAMRVAAQRLYNAPLRINPVIPAELVIDHSVQVDAYGSDTAFADNEAAEYARNHERYAFLRWGQEHFNNFQVVPPATGICHQVNLEYLARGVCRRRVGDQEVAFPDSLVGLDSHTTMINGLGVAGWGVGGIEAEAVMLGRPYYLLTPQVIGFKLTGQRAAGVTATDVVLHITEILRKKGVVGKFVEFYGSGLSHLRLEDRATIANMAPEYGATMGFFPVDQQTLDYLRLTGRNAAQVSLVETCCKVQGLFRTDEMPEPRFTDTVTLDLGVVEPCLAGPKRPQDRLPLHVVPASLPDLLQKETAHPAARATVTLEDESVTLSHGDVVIAAITSCTNTSNPSVLLAAGLLARRAVARGLKVKPWVKTSLAPGSKVVAAYLEKAGVMADLARLNFHLVAYGCTTCIGNSGPLLPPIADAIVQNNLSVAAVLSGNRNFEGRINPLTRLNYLASPPLVVAYALAGTLNIDFSNTPLGQDAGGQPVFLRDIWPSDEEVQALVGLVDADMYQKAYAAVYAGTERWRALPVPAGDLYAWDSASTYIKMPPFFDEVTADIPPLRDLHQARVLALLGDSVTTDHISPAGSIPADSPAGRYLIGLGVSPADFNSYGARRGNHDVMLRGTFGNIRLQNHLVPDIRGGHTLLLPEKTPTWLYDAAMTYQARQVPLLVLAGKEYGTGSSRDWAAKGTRLLGIKAVLAESFERIHRSNLVCMGVLPLQFPEGTTAAGLGLDGTESYDITGIANGLTPGGRVRISARHDKGSTVNFEALVRLDSPVEVTYYRHGGILPYMLRDLGESA